ncbi:MAG: VCBS repeat-containing protein [Sandaracinus sp.]|nr:VCBS repeat-containing protein [Sandaracinus sp.]
MRRFDSRLPWALLLVLLLAGLFWGLSRGPALHEKATMAGEVALDALGFDTWVEVREDDPFAKKLYGITVNWIATNRIGMTFGVLFGGALMTVFSLRRRRTREPRRDLIGGVGASALGVVSGAPLGVCVNCAAPIAQGLVAGGSRFETALAAMMSSPTMNGVALFLLFTLFPLHVALVKLGLTLFLLLVIVPMLGRGVLRSDRDRTLEQTAPAKKAGPDALPFSEGDSAPLWVLRSFGRYAFFVARTTVPLMLVAGAFGALVVLVLPFDRLPELLGGDTLAAVLLVSFGLALFGAALPVPITFDVILCAVLYAAGLPLRYVAVLLFTLGVYSVYSGLVVSRALSLKSALVIYATVAFLGVVAGDVTQALANRERRDVLAGLAELPAEEPTWRVAWPETSLDDRPFDTIRTDAERLAPHVLWRAPRVADSAEGDASFVPLDADRAGLSVPSRLRAWSFEYPFVQGRGRSLGVGDVDADGLDDLLVISEAGVAIFRNASTDGEVRFERHALPMDGVPLFAVFVDHDRDGALDLLVADLDGLLYLRGPLLRAAPTDEPSCGTCEIGERFERVARLAAMPAAMGAHETPDGRVELVVSTWSPSWRSPWKTSEGSTTYRFVGIDSRRAPEELVGRPGAATSVLFADLDGDGDDDVLVGHDFAPPDAPYRREPARGASMDTLTRDETLVPATTRDTMGLAAGDLDGDGHDELFFTDIAEIHGGPRRSVEEACATIDDARCEADAAFTRAYLALRRRDDPAACDALEDPTACRGAYFLGRAHLLADGDEGCAFPEGWPLHRRLCEENVQAPYLPNELARARGPLQRRGTNVMLRWRDGRYVEATPSSVAHTGWTWHPRFVDANGDGHLDLFLATGTPTAVARRESNELFLGDGEGGLTRATDRLGLVDHRPTHAAVWIDLEGDGDLDLVSMPIVGQLQVRRREGGPRGVTVEVRGVGALGAKLTLRTGEGANEHVQHRRLRASGGYLSFDRGVAHLSLVGADEGELEVTRTNGVVQRARVRAGRVVFLDPSEAVEVPPNALEAPPEMPSAEPPLDSPSPEEAP